MLVHPFEYRLTPIPGTRLLEETFGLIGETVQWPKGRSWSILGIYAPTGKNSVSAGIRARIKDPKGFYSFINQRDLEVLLDASLIGRWCRWMGEVYPEPGDRNFYGPCVDSSDLQDDLFAVEQRLRQEYEWGVLPPLSLERRIHDFGADWEREELLLQDADPYTGACPDTRLETIDRRWVTSERRPVIWERL